MFLIITDLIKPPVWIIIIFDEYHGCSAAAIPAKYEREIR